MPLSMLGKEQEYERIVGILENYRNFEKINEEIMKIRKKKNLGKINDKEYEHMYEALSKARDEIEHNIKFPSHDPFVNPYFISTVFTL